MFFNRNKQSKPNQANPPEAIETQASPEEALPLPAPQPTPIPPQSSQKAPRPLTSGGSLFANTAGAPKPAIDFGFSQFQEAPPKPVTPEKKPPALSQAVLVPTPEPVALDVSEADSPDAGVAEEEPPEPVLTSEPETLHEPVAPNFDTPLETFVPDITLAVSEQFEAEALALEVPPLPDLDIPPPALWSKESNTNPETPEITSETIAEHLEVLETESLETEEEMLPQEIPEEDLLALRESWQQVQQEHLQAPTAEHPVNPSFEEESFEIPTPMPLPKMIDLPPSHIELASPPASPGPLPVSPIPSSQASAGDDFYSHLAPGFEEDLGSLVVEPLDTRPESLQDTIQESFYPNSSHTLANDLSFTEPESPCEPLAFDEPAAQGFDFELDTTENEPPLWESAPETTGIFRPGQQPADELQAHLDILYTPEETTPSKENDAPEPSPGPSVEEEAEVDIIDFYDLGNDRTLALVDWDGNYALMGQRGDETDTVKVFDAAFKHSFGQLPEETRRLQALKAFTVGKSDMFQVKVGTWSGVVIVDNESFVLQSEMS